MGKNKLQRFEENKAFRHLIQPPTMELLEKDLEWKGRWNAFFGNDKPLVAEFGCGRGEYTIGLAKYFPEKNFIGMDIKGARLWYGANTIENEKIPNAAFIRSRVDFITKIFAPGELDEIWITFPDPQPQKPRERKRLTSPRFINRYRHILKPDGLIHLKTDNEFFFDYTLEVIRENKLTLHKEIRDIHSSPDKTSDAPWLSTINTFYEKIFLAQDVPIHYLSFSPPSEALDEGKSRAIEDVRYSTRVR